MRSGLRVPFPQVDATSPHGAPELNMLLSDLSADADTPRLSYILACFARFWEEDYRAFVVPLKQQREADTGSGSGASFLELLRRIAWVPGTDGELHVPCDVFSGAAKNARAIFHDWAVFVSPAAEAGLEDQQCISFYDDVGVCSKLTLQLAIQLLNKRCACAKYMKLTALRRVYKYMDDNWKDVECSETLVQPMIFVPNRESSSLFQGEPKGKYFELLDNEDIPGVWLTPAECVWSDPSYIVDSLRAVAGGFHITHQMNDIATRVTRALGDYYGEGLKPFFLGKLNVMDVPASNAYVKIMCQAAEEYPNGKSHSVACILRVMNHFAYNLRELRAEHASDYDDSPEYIELKNSSSKITVPTALYTGLVRLKDVCWSANFSTSNIFETRGFGDAVLQKCVPRDFPLDCQCGVYDLPEFSRGWSRRCDHILVHELNVMQKYFYDEVWRVPILSIDDVHQRVEVLPPAGGASDWPSARPAAGVTVCHILARTLQRWSREHVPDPAAREKIRASILALSLVVVAGPIRVRRKWVFVSPVDGSEIEGRDTVDAQEAACALDLAARGFPRLYATQDVLTLKADPRAFARCFATLVVTDTKVPHHQHHLVLPTPPSKLLPSVATCYLAQQGSWIRALRHYDNALPIPNPHSVCHSLACRTACKEGSSRKLEWCKVCRILYD
jgi:hypothetical protein